MVDAPPLAPTEFKSCQQPVKVAGIRLMAEFSAPNGLSFEKATKSESKLLKKSATKTTASNPMIIKSWFLLDFGNLSESLFGINGNYSINFQRPLTEITGRATRSQSGDLGDVSF